MLLTKAIDFYECKSKSNCVLLDYNFCDLLVHYLFMWFMCNLFQSNTESCHSKILRLKQPVSGFSLDVDTLDDVIFLLQVLLFPVIIFFLSMNMINWNLLIFQVFFCLSLIEDISGKIQLLSDYNSSYLNRLPVGIPYRNNKCLL